MYKTELIARVAQDTRLSQRVVAAVLTTTVKEIEYALRQGHTVQVPGFGTFYTRQRPAGEVRHMTTGKQMRVPAMRVAGFRAGAILKRVVRENTKEREIKPKKRGLRRLLNR